MTDQTLDDSEAEPVPDTDLPEGESLASLPKATDNIKIPAPGGNVPDPDKLEED